MNAGRFYNLDRSRPHVFNNIKNILIIKPGSLGDIVHSLPFLAAVKNHFPAVSIDWVVAHGLHPFLKDHPMIDNLWVIKKDEWKKIRRIRKSLKEINALRRSLSLRHYDVAVDLSGLFRSGLITYFSKAKIKLGFKESDEGSPSFYTHKVHGSMRIHAIDRYLEIAKYMGCKPGSIEYPFAPYDPNPEILQSLPPAYCIIAPSAGKPANRWGAEKFGLLASKLHLPAVVTASASENDIAEKVVSHSKGNAISAAGKTGLKDLPGLIKKTAFFICNDTGPMHIATALNIPVFAIFGPANPIRTGPYGNNHTVIQHKMDCAPCYAKNPCSHFKCMNELSVDTVHTTIKETMGME